MSPRSDRFDQLHDAAGCCRSTPAEALDVDRILAIEAEAAQRAASPPDYAEALHEYLGVIRPHEYCDTDHDAGRFVAALNPGQEEDR